MSTLNSLAARAGRPAPIQLALWLLTLLALGMGGPRPALAQEPAYTPTRFSVEVAGDGPEVIFIPGLATSREVWRETAEALGPNYRVHLVQVKGFGEPAGPNAQGPVLEPLVDELARYISQNGLDRPAIVGHSLGGLVALMLGADRPSLPGRLMIVDALPWFGATVTLPGSDATPASLEEQARQMRDTLVASYGTNEAGRQTATSISSYVLNQSKLPLLREWTDDADSRVTGQLVYEDLMTDMRERIGDIVASLTVVYPWNEHYPTQTQAEPFYRSNYAALSHAGFIGIGPAAHFVMTDQPAAFQRALAEFLKD